MQYRGVSTRASSSSARAVSRERSDQQRGQSRRLQRGLNAWPSDVTTRSESGPCWHHSAGLVRDLCPSRTRGRPSSADSWSAPTGTTTGTTRRKTWHPSSVGPRPDGTRRTLHGLRPHEWSELHQRPATEVTDGPPSRSTARSHEPGGPSEALQVRRSTGRRTTDASPSQSTVGTGPDGGRCSLSTSRSHSPSRRLRRPPGCQAHTA